jgi:Family of unknown function (DUF6445)
LSVTALLTPSRGFFNAQVAVQEVRFGSGRVCHVVDDALTDPSALVDWAATQTLDPPQTNAYPGRVAAVPAALSHSLDSFFAQHLRSRMGGRRTLDMYARLSLVTQQPAQLRPCQWLCHRDRAGMDPREVLFAASVLYLFTNPDLGGTSFFEPRQSAADTAQLLNDAQVLTNAEFAQRYGLMPGYLCASNDYFEQVAQVPARWNRLIFYDGGLFHSGHLARPDLLKDDVRTGRLTVNGFFGCKRAAR